MMILSIEQINSRAGYSVRLSSFGEFRFETELGIGYSISFEEEMPMGGCNTYQFVIRKMDDCKSPHDPKVEQTILGTQGQVPVSFMATNNNFFIIINF